MPTPETTDDARGEAGATTGRWAVRIAATLLILLVLYVLSIGPAQAIVVWGRIDDDSAAGAFITFFYAPVEELIEDTPLRGPFEASTEWWAHMAERLS